MLARETLTRSSLETQKLELMSEVANLKLRQAAIDRENMDLRKRLAKTLDLSTAATAALAAAANAAAASTQNHNLNSSTGKAMYPLYFYFYPQNYNTISFCSYNFKQIILIMIGKVSTAIGSTSLTITEKSSNSESPPQHYRQREVRNNHNELSKPLYVPNLKAYNANNGNANPTDGYSKAELTSVQGYGTLPRRSKKSSSSSGNSSCITAIQARVCFLI